MVSKLDLTLSIHCFENYISQQLDIMKFLMNTKVNRQIVRSVNDREPLDHPIRDGFLY